MQPNASSSELALAIVRQLQAAGHVAYWAGGCVRDQIMGRIPKDYDVATAARPEEVLAIFPRAQKVGVAFGVVLVKGRGSQVEIATFRSDGAYTDGRHPDSVRFTTAQDDAKRRDFTCNGLFFDPVAQQIHDYVGGRSDIAARILRAIGAAEDRFAEDHLRLLRALRFAARLEFTIEERTRSAMSAAQSRIASISRERIGEEIRMMLEHSTRVGALALLAGFGELFAEVFGVAPPADGESWPVVSGLAEQASRALVLAAVLADLECPDWKASTRTLRTRLMLSNQEMERMLWLGEKLPLLQRWESLPKAALKRMMANPAWPDLDALYRADPRQAQELLAFSERSASLLEEGAAPPPLITGDKLKTLGVVPGPDFKRWLDELYDRQLEGEFASAEEAMRAARKLVAR